MNSTGKGKEKAYEELVRLVTETPVLKTCCELPFLVSLEVLLLQGGQPMVYDSRALTCIQIQKKYAHVEKEILEV